ncbi:YybH family protein [Sphingopyxis kveilinensis]|uniref:YybH family protein n=1 Tax=Sphingopyxis kveilinensis TaxID=3114367 RepID=UPI0030CAC67E
MTDDRTTIKTLLAARDAALSAGEANAAVAATAVGATSFELQPPLSFTHDPAAAAADLDEWFTTWNGRVTTHMVDPEILVSGDLAVAYGLATIAGDKKGEGPIHLWFRRTVVLERSAGGWQIVHQHSSVPMMMDGSGLAAVHLKP